MAAFCVSYDVKYAQPSQAKPVYITDRVSKEACFSELFYGGRSYHKGCKPVISVDYWLLNGGFDAIRKDADWFVKCFILKNLPERMDRRAFKFYVKEEAPKDIHHTGKYWLSLDIRLDKVNATDLYMLLMLFRYPQENPDFATKMRERLKANRKISQSVAFSLTHTDGVAVGFGHLVMHPSAAYMGEVEEWSLKDRWQEIPLNGSYKLPYFQYCNKHSNINGHFRIAGKQTRPQKSFW